MRYFKIIDVKQYTKKIQRNVDHKCGRYKSIIPISAAKKAFTSLCRLHKIKGKCSMVITIQETSKNNEGKSKSFTYKVSRVLLKKPIIRFKDTAKEFKIKYVIKAKTIKKNLSQLGGDETKCFDANTLDDVKIKDFLKQETDNFVLKIGNKYECHRLKNIRTQHRYSSGKYNEWYPCNNNIGKYGPDSVNTLSNHFIKLTNFNLFVIKPEWMYFGPVPEPRIFNVIKYNSEIAMVSKEILEGNSDLLSRDHCNHRTPVLTYYLTNKYENASHKIKLFVFTDSSLRKAIKSWLHNKKAAIKKYGHIQNWNTKNVSDMSRLFEGAETFNDPIGNWDTSNVTDMHAMFDGASKFNQPIGNWDTSNVADMSEMFNDAEKFNQPLNTRGNKWDTSNVTDMHEMFLYAESFNYPIDKWNITNVGSMNRMFQGAESFDRSSINSWDLSNVYDTTQMFGMFS